MKFGNLCLLALEASADGMGMDLITSFMLNNDMLESTLSLFKNLPNSIKIDLIKSFLTEDDNDNNSDISSINSNVSET